VPDQRAIVRQYMKYEHEIRFPHNAVQIIFRALQFATSTPQGPVYLIASRETLEAETAHPAATGPTKPSQTYEKNRALEQTGLSPAAVEYLAEILCQATRPLIVTSYAGRTAAGFEALVDLATLLSIAVHENAPIVNSFPTTSPLHQGHQWNGGGQLPALAEADIVLVVDSDVPWIPSQSRPHPDARIFHLDSDPLKTSTTLWSLPCERRWMCDSAVALEQIRAHVKASSLFAAEETQATIAARLARLKSRFEERTKRLRIAELPLPDGKVTVPYFMSRLREATAGIRVLGLNESTTNLGNVADHLGHSSAQTLMGSGGGSLGWYSGAAVGASLGLREEGRPDVVVAFVGDGTWLFGAPASAYWMAQKYDCPFLTIVWNNGGWASPKNACARIRPEVLGMLDSNDAGPSSGSSLAEAMGVSLSPSPAFGKIAEGAGGSWWWNVLDVKDVDVTIKEAIRVVREKRKCALIDVRLQSI
jgi:acetolactate synthase-1/2/3 large subunit